MLKALHLFALILAWFVSTFLPVTATADDGPDLSAVRLFLMPTDPYIFSFGHVGEDAAADPFADPVGGSNGRKLPVNRKTYKGAAGKA